MSVRMFWQVQSNPRLFVTTFDVFTAGGVTPQQVADGVVAASAGAGRLQARWPNTVKLVRVTYDTPTDQGINEVGWTGTHTASALAPPQVTYLVTKGGGLRRRQGRMFLPGVIESAVDDLGQITNTALITDFNTALSTFLSQLAAGGFPMRQRSPSSGGGTVAVTSLQLQTRVSTQRRRMRR